MKMEDCEKLLFCVHFKNINLFMKKVPYGVYEWGFK
jgi:hypothetical protein